MALQNGRMAAHESSLERDWLMVLDFDWRVRRVSEQPFTFRYDAGERLSRYTPDVLAEFDDHLQKWTVVYEVKQIEELRASWADLRPRFKAALRYCRERGWKFKLITERDLYTPYVENIKFLRRYRDIPQDPMHREALLYTMKALGETNVQTLIAATWTWQERQWTAIPHLWTLIAERAIETTLIQPLTMASRIWLP